MYFKGNIGSKSMLYVLRVTLEANPYCMYMYFKGNIGSKSILYVLRVTLETNKSGKGCYENIITAITSHIPACPLKLYTDIIMYLLYVINIIMWFVHATMRTCSNHVGVTGSYVGVAAHM